MIDKLVLVFCTIFTVSCFPTLLHASDSFSFMDFTWDDSGQAVKNKMTKNNFQIRREFETKSPDFLQSHNEAGRILDYKKQMISIEAKLPSSLLGAVNKLTLQIYS